MELIQRSTLNSDSSCFQAPGCYIEAQPIVAKGCEWMLSRKLHRSANNTSAAEAMFQLGQQQPQIGHNSLSFTWCLIGHAVQTHAVVDSGQGAVLVALLFTVECV